MKKVSVLLVFIMLLSLVVNVGRVSASDEHKVLLFGDSLTATNMSNWTYKITHDYKLVAKGGQDTRWVLSQIRQLVKSGEINSYDTAVVWIGVNNPELAVSEIPQIYAILHSYGIKIVGVTQYLPTYGNPNQETVNNIHDFNDIVRETADIVVDFAVDPEFVDENGYLRDEISLDGIHLKPRLMAEPIANVIDEAIDELYAPKTFEVSEEEASFLATHEFNTGDRSRKVVMMTYDDGGQPVAIEKVMSIAERYGGKVTFFVQGTWLEKNPEMAREIVSRGHLLECHGWDHTDMSKMTEAEIRKQITDFLTLAKQILPDYQVKYIRFPYGARNDLAIKMVGEYGLQSVMWSVESGGKDETTYHNVVDRVYSGAIVLSHTNRQPDLDALARIFATLSSRGYSFETVETGRALTQIWNGN